MLHYFTDIIQSDSVEETREVSSDVAAPQEINANFNLVITYGKGGAIVNMASYILGLETFKSGLTVSYMINENLKF
jgi:aminopeptidase N